MAFLPDGTKPLPKPMLTNNQWGLVEFTLGLFHRNCSRYLSLTFDFEKYSFKITAASPRVQWINLVYVYFSGEMRISWYLLVNSALFVVVSVWKFHWNMSLLTIIWMTKSLLVDNISTSYVENMWPRLWFILTNIANPILEIRQL